MKRARVSDFPTIRVAVHPRTLEALSAEAEERALPLSAVVREALDRAVRPAVSLSPQGVAPEKYGPPRGSHGPAMA